jgi:hypothetical protein
LSIFAEPPVSRSFPCSTVLWESSAYPQSYQGEAAAMIFKPLRARV